MPLKPKEPMEELTGIFVAFLGIIFFITAPLWAARKRREEILADDSKAVLEKCEKIAAEFYALEETEDFKEITQEILSSKLTNKSIKKIIRSTGRRFFLFKYPSDHQLVKGTISFVPEPSKNPLLLLLRGGTEIFGLMHPASDLACIRNYTTLATAYRGGVSEGKDEFGGSDVNDVTNLVQYLTTLQKKLDITLELDKIFIIGASRGGMEMFLSLGRSQYLQQKIKKAVSLSGLLDMQACLADRQDMKQMFMEDFGLLPGINEEEWINLRNPIGAVSSLRKDLPFLILQGTKDIRVSLKEGYNMVKKLKENGNPVTYLEITNGDHCLRNQKDYLQIMADWLES